MTLRTFETHIHEDNVKAQVAAYLAASGLIRDEDDLVNIELGNAGDDGLVPVTLKVQKLEYEGGEQVSGGNG